MKKIKESLEEMSYERIRDIEVLEDYLLRVKFNNGVIKIYDCKPLFEKDAFKLIGIRTIINQIKSLTFPRSIFIIQNKLFLICLYVRRNR